MRAGYFLRTKFVFSQPSHKIKVLVLHFCQNDTNPPTLPNPAQLPVNGRKVCHNVTALTRDQIEEAFSPYRTYYHILSLRDSLSTEEK